METGPYTLSIDSTDMQNYVIHGYLTKSYWAKGISLATVQRSLDNSICVGVFDAAREQVGFARVVSDQATFAYLADVFVLPAHTGRGLARQMLDTLFALEELQGLRRWLLATVDAHSLYEKYGFTPLDDPARLMTISKKNLYISSD